MGSIDATYYRDGAHQYLVWKSDGNDRGLPTVIFAQELNVKGTGFAPGSHPVELLRNDPHSWEGICIEGPWLVQRKDAIYLFYRYDPLSIMIVYLYLSFLFWRGYGYDLFTRNDSTS